MGGKRPDQYRLDQGEGGATDYKFSRKLPREDPARDHRYSELMEGELKRRQPIPSKAPSPEARQARQRELERQAHLHGEKPEAGTRKSVQPGKSSERESRPRSSTSSRAKRHSS
jgi:hypothetical protein